MPHHPEPQVDVLPASQAQQRQRHRDDSLGSLPAARATLARLGVTHADWPGQRALVVQVALRSYRLQPHRHLAALHEVVAEAGAVRVIGSAWTGLDSILDHLWAERARELELEGRPLAPGRWRVAVWLDPQGVPVLAETDPQMAQRVALDIAARSPGAWLR